MQDVKTKNEKYHAVSYVDKKKIDGVMHSLTNSCVSDCTRKLVSILFMFKAKYFNRLPNTT